MKLLLIAFLLIPFVSHSQSDSIPINADGKYEYSEVVNVDSASAQKLYSNAKIFIVTAFKSGKAVTQLNDDAAKTVAGNGTEQVFTKGLVGSAINKFIKFRILIQSKDGRYKYSITNFEIHFISDAIDRTYALEDSKNKVLTKKQTVEVFQQLNTDMHSLIAELKKTMASKTESTQDW